MTAASPIVEINEVSFGYNGHLVLDDVHFNIFPNDFIAVIGPNGGGKTTLLKLILGLLTPDKGTVRVLGEKPCRASHHIGYVPQNIYINNSFPITVRDVVLMGKMAPGRRLSRFTTKEKQDACDALEKMGMAPWADKRIGELSGGQRQRVFIARALVSNPELLLLDEPTASIDSKGQTDFYSLLHTLNKHTTILIVSHDLLVISTHVKSVACVNKRLHYHKQTEITDDMIENMYPCTVEEVCPVELVAHGLPHRVLKYHKD